MRAQRYIDGFTAAGGASQFGARRIASRTRPSTSFREAPMSLAMVGATSMFSTMGTLMPVLIPAPDATKALESGGCAIVRL